MDDKLIHTFDQLEYNRAESVPFKCPKSSARNKLKAIFGFVCLLVREWICSFLSFFVNPKAANVSGQLCLITGGANGLGRCLAMRFAQEGCNIAIVDIVDSENTVREIREKFHVDCQGFNCDVSNIDAIEKMKNEVESSMGTVDILVNNAGLLYMGHFLKCSIEAIQKVVNVNLMSHLKVK